MYDSFVTRGDAADLCEGAATHEEEPSLLFIKSKEEQDFLTDYIFNEVVDSVWLGAMRIDNESNFAWDDNTTVLYSNWAPEYPTDNEERPCVRMMSELSIRAGPRALNGQWADVSCDSRNLVVCQKMATWSVLYLQKRLLAMPDELSNLNILIFFYYCIYIYFCLNFASANNQFLPFSVPVGFLYNQYRTEEESPVDLWPSMGWEQVVNATTQWRRIS